MVGIDERETVGRLIVDVLVATMCGYLAWLAAILVVEQLPRLLIAAFTSVRVAGFDASLASPGWQIRPPERASRSLFSLYLMSVPMWGVILLPLGPPLLLRLRGWSALFAAQVVLIIGWRVSVYGALIGSAGWFHSWYPTPFNGSSWASSVAFRLLLGIALAGSSLFLGYRTIRRFLDGVGGQRKERFAALGRWFLIPLVIVGAAVTRLAQPHGNLLGWTPLAMALVFLLASALPAAYSTRVAGTAARPGSVGAAAVSVCFVLVVGSLLGYGWLQGTWRRDGYLSEFSVSRSEYAILHIQKPLLETKNRETWIKEQDDRLRSIAAHLGVPLPASKLHLYLYRSSTLKRSMTGSDAPFTIPPGKAEVHLLTSLAEDLRGSALLLMQEAWGKPASEIVAQAIARYAVGNFLGYSLRKYASRVIQEEGPFSLGEVLGLDARFFSPILRDVLGGAWVEQLVDRHGSMVIEHIYRGPLTAGNEEVFAGILGTRWSSLEAEWQAYQAKLRQISLDRDIPVSKEPFYQRGMTLTQRGYGTGYGSERAMEQLEHLRRRGVNTITLVPYAGTRAPRDATISIFEDSRDDRVTRTLQGARGIGLRCVLKPHLSSGDEFVGNITFEDPGRFKAWFENYRRWLLHYARIAALYRVDCLVVGTELAGVTRHEAAWRALIRDVRAVYSGPVAYAAHWGRDFEELPFWDALDYIGVNMYYPLAGPGEEVRPDSRRMRELVGIFERTANRFGKRIVFTEVGFPNTASAAEEPYRKTNKPLALDLQARCTRTVLEAFGHQAWCGGMNWWEWPTTGQSGSLYETYILSGNPAGEIVTAWYSAMRER